MKAIKYLGLMPVLTFSALASADYVCKSTDGKGYVVHTYDLSNPNEFKTEHGAAVILKQKGQSHLLTGTVSTTPTRVGTHVFFNLVNNKGEVLGIALNESFQPFAIGCGRGGCDPVDPQPKKSAQIITKDGNYAISCSETLN